MTLSFRRIFALVIAIALFASACSSGSDAGTTELDTETAAAPDPTVEPSADTAAEQSNADDDAATEAEGTTAAEPTSIPVPDDDTAAEDAIEALDDATSESAEGAGNEPPAEAPDATTVAQGFVRSRFNIDPEQNQLDCIVAQAPGNAALEAALASSEVAQGIVLDAELKAMTLAMSGCVDPISLGDWATQAVGPQGEVAETAPACFADRFSDPERGDVTFYTFVALTYQFRVEPDGVPDITDAFVDCAPITGLVTFFAGQYEATRNFGVTIDQDCATEALDDPDVSRLFWSTLIEGLQPPVEVIDDLIGTCAEEVGDDLSGPVPTGSIPADFVAWSGIGALSDVSPDLRAGIYDAAPPMTISADGNYQAVIQTGGGEIRVQLFADTAPLTVNNFVNLARDGYYDQTVFHRVIPGFMAQAGDPTGTGTGGPGYSFADEFEGGREFTGKGILAMANSGPATNGSQFFITFDATDWLNGAHTIFGEVIEGIEIVDAIQPRDPSNPAGRGQVLESITIIEG